MLLVAQNLVDAFKGKAPLGVKRSPKWRKVRAKYLKANPVCEICGTSKSLEVHHILPFHWFPSAELDPDNLMTLCDGWGKKGSRSCHLLFGHYGNWKKYNRHMKSTALIWSHNLDKG